MDAYLCLGSNSPNASERLHRAIQALAALGNCILIAASSVYLTEPQNFPDQPWFQNQVLRMGIGSELTHTSLMNKLLAIEQSLGRTRSGPRFGPRTIDIDLLLFGDIVSADPFCILPHPRLVQRAFALVPLLELAPGISIHGESAKSWLARLNWRQEGKKIFQ